MISLALSCPGFDNEEFELAFTAADFERCHELIDPAAGLSGELARARLALREYRPVDVVGSLSGASTPGEAGAARDVLLGAALGLTRDFAGGDRLINRALQTLPAGDPRHDDGLYYKALIAWMKHDYREAEEAASAAVTSPLANNRARAHILLSWITLRRGDVLGQVEELQKALDELDKAALPDQFYRANALYTLALLCRELPLHEVAPRVRTIFEALPWTSGLRLEHFQVTRLLAAIDELGGNELAAFANFRKATRLAPSEHWSVLCYLDRALLAKNTGEMAFAAEQLQEAYEIAQRLSWSEATGEERSALLVLAELFSYGDAGIAEQFLARFRTISSSVIPILSYGTDPRVKGLEAYTQGVAWLRLGDVDEGKAALNEAWSIFENFNYAWRAALCAMALHDATQDRRWIQQAAKRIEPWPRSWIARRIAEMGNTPMLRLDRIPRAKRDVLELVRAGRRNSEIASILGRSPNTVRNQLAALFQMFNVRSRAELIAVLSKPLPAPLTSLDQHRRRRRANQAGLV